MGTMIAFAVGYFCSGIIAGLLLSPSTEREQNAYTQGFVAGVAHMAKEPTP